VVLNGFPDLNGQDHDKQYGQRNHDPDEEAKNPVNQGRERGRGRSSGSSAGAAVLEWDHGRRSPLCNRKRRKNFGRTGGGMLLKNMQDLSFRERAAATAENRKSIGRRGLHQDAKRLVLGEQFIPGGRLRNGIAIIGSLRNGHLLAAARAGTIW
jgi:hypothetical protein